MTKKTNLNAMILNVAFSNDLSARINPTLFTRLEEQLVSYIQQQIICIAHHICRNVPSLILLCNSETHLYLYMLYSMYICMI